MACCGSFRPALAALKTGSGSRAFSAASKVWPSQATHGGLAPKLEEHYMSAPMKAHDAHFFPNNPDYHWVHYYGGDAAPAWELPKDNPQPGWIDRVTSEYKNAVENCAIDIPLYGVLDIKGPKAFEFVDRSVTKKCSRKVGDIRLGYTLTEEGTLWNDVSLATRGENDVYFVGLAGFGKYEMDDMNARREHFGYTKEEVQITNASYDQQLMHIFGPKAPKILSEVLGPEVLDVPFFKFRKMTVKGIPLEVFSMSYAALPGFELHVPKEHAAQIYDMLLSHPLGKAEGFKPCGIMGIQALRTEMWFRGSPDVKNIVHYKGGQIEKAIGKNHSFFGQDAPDVKQKQVIMLQVDTPKGLEWSLYGAQWPVFHNGQEVGHTLHSALGARTQVVHAFALVDAKVHAPGNKFEIHAHSQEMPSVQLAQPLAESTLRYK